MCRRRNSMIDVVRLTPERFDEFIELVNALADYEHLNRPPADAVERLRADAFAPSPRFVALLGLLDGKAVGYAITLETYSSFLAKPTQYLEDLFVLEDARTHGVGGRLFDAVHDMARTNGCGRMEWQVLDWNMLARDFYARRQATYMKEWLVYRITL
ncbi:MAG: GNAT family N-acetyltransferase [Candidatus Kapabacteria bacterium]|nr:GNAT family N-acetyltransferase [Candidatus Kapabacteria bacterium]